MSSLKDKVVITCAVTGVLTDPKTHPVPVTPSEMAQSCKEAYDAGASIVHLHFRNQTPGKGALPSWDPNVAYDVVSAIREVCPDLLINLSTGVLGDDIRGPLACLERVRPDTAALNAGSLNYLKSKSDGNWAWPPMLFDNKVEKIAEFLKVMDALKIIPECECFDTGILRSISMFEETGLLKRPYTISLVMGVASGMPAKPSWLPLLLEEMPKNSHWQTIAIGRKEVWDVHQLTCELGGHLRTGLEDTFYLPNGEKTHSNGKLISAMAQIAKNVGREIATPADVRQMLKP